MENNQQQTFEALYQQLNAKKANPQPDSYTNYLYTKGLDKILKKVGEESTEVIVAAKNNREELIYETADLIFHLFVLLNQNGVSLTEIKTELGRREGQKSRIHERQDWR
ncbi:phosphoribosyl-ATP diphosphatase [Fructilactobacillus frigidiflavus]|uniref:phosphoribosyl-ATP diphosphatase n=1 Tax=Fructilactobacillus frigidiflavus TaxID=3242688 RepID=UPI0037564F27